MQEQVLAAATGVGEQSGLDEEAIEQSEASLLVARNKGFASTFLPTVAVGRRTIVGFNRAVVAFVACAGAFGAAAEISYQSACAAFENVLCDVIIASPSKRAGVVGAEYVQGRQVHG